MPLAEFTHAHLLALVAPQKKATEKRLTLSSQNHVKKASGFSSNKFRFKKKRVAVLGGDHVTCTAGKQICKRPKIRQKAGAGDRQTWKWF